MRLKSTLLFFILLNVGSAITAQIRPGWCIQDATISVSGGQSELYFCEGDGIADQARFKVTPFAQPFAYLVTDENNIILRVSRNNTINFEGLGGGKLRVWAFAYLGNILAEVGQDATNSVLADICYGLTQNFIPVGSIVPNAGSVATSDGRSSLFTCRDDGNSDVITFTNTSSDPFYTYVITDENNVILAFTNDANSFDFESLSTDKVRVWGVSYIGSIRAKVGDDITKVAFASGCFDLSDNFVAITRAMPNGGTVSLTTGETNKTICAEDLSGDILTFTSQGTTTNPYAFVVTDENGNVIAILNGNNADFSLTAPGVCRVYGVSFTGELKVLIGDNINNAVLSDDCYDVSDNFVQIIKREVDGGMVRLAGGGSNATVCVEGGLSDILSFVNTSTVSGSNYVYLITNQNNVILAIANGSTFNFANLNSRDIRVWGLSYTGTLLAKVGDNAATAALSGECYDLSDNFLTITRKSVDGGIVSLTNGSSTAAICRGDNAPDTLSFKNTSTSVESYIYLVTDLTGNVLGFINGHQFNFASLSQDSFLVYGLSYSGAFTVPLGSNINSVNFSSECADLSGNFVTIIVRSVEGGRVSLEGITDDATFCSGDGASDIGVFSTSSSSTENFVFLITNANNQLVNIALGNTFDFEDSPTGEYHVWGLSYIGNLQIAQGQSLVGSTLADNCFELSENFATINVFETDGGTVSLINGDTSAVVCLNTAQATEFAFENTSTAGNYAYLVTNEANIILAIANGNSFDFASLPVGNYRVWGVSFAGTLTAQAGQNAATAVLASDCYQLSENFISIGFQQVDGGVLSLSNGGETATVCIGDTNTDELSFTTTSTTASYVYLITDENNKILAISDENNFDFNNINAAVVRVWGLGFSGNLTAQIADNAGTATLSDECFDLSNNFITVTRKNVDGATVSLASGDTLAVSCAGVPELTPLAFANTSSAGSSYTYLVTDETTNVLAIAQGNNFSFDTFPQGNYRVWGLSYTGNLNVQVGDDAILVPLSDECFDLSDNFITVIRKDVDGGMVSLNNGDTTVAVCGASSTPGQLIFDFESSANSNYLFVITTTNNDVFAVLLGNSVNFNGVRNGEYRVWGVSYTGNPTVRTGRNLFEIPLSSECFDVSDNFILIKKDATTGGTIAATSADTSLIFCPGNGKADVVQLSTNGDSSGDYIYILTNANNGFISIIPDSTINFDTLPIGIYRIRGLAYTGDLSISVGANVTNTELSNECFDLSDNFIQVTNQLPDGGTVALAEGLTQQFTCPADGKADTIAFFNEGNIGKGFVFLITDENNIIEAITEENTYDFESDTEGTNRIWGLAYSGNLTAKVGDNAATAALSDDCFDLSNNFIEITRELPVGGDVTLENGDTLTYVCLNTGGSSIVKFDSTGTSRGDYIYVITDENNIIRNGIFGDEFDFSFLSLGTFRVWGLAYTGTLTATIGDVVTNVPISDDCFELSDTYATVVVSDPDAGTVATESGATAVTICVGDGEADVIAFDSVATTMGRYNYLITNKNNILLAVSEGDSFDFETIDADTCRVWGISYTGALQVQIGENITTAALADGCFDLSDNFILINRSLVDGGMIASDRPGEVIYTCVGDGVADVITFSNNSGAQANYIYVLTNENNQIRGTITGNQFNFETAGVGVTRVWGVSFTGAFAGAFNANILTTSLASGCFQVSENFITISRDRPLGGDISTADGATSTLFCPSPNEPGLIFETTSNRRLSYAFVVTDTNNVVLAFSNQDTVNFEALPVGTYRIWGLSFAGELQLALGDNILGSDPLASSCFEISSNFVTVYRSTLVDGGRISNLGGPDTLYVCRGNESEDLVILGNDSEASDADYLYVLTNQNNTILLPSLSSEAIDFNGAAPGIYRIWGVSFTGTYEATASDNIASAQLSDSCYQTSENFITVFVDTPNGGTVATTDSLTLIEPNLDLGEPQLFSFMSNNTSIVKYQYVVTNVNNEIVAFIDSVDVDFEGLAAWGTLRVWGLAYTGTIKVGVGEDLDSGDPLTNDCFDLSDNFVVVAFPVPVTGDDTQIFQYETPIATVLESYSQIKVDVAPNPASHRIRVSISAERPQIEDSNLRIYSVTGQLMYEQNLLVKKGDNQLEVRINDFPDGLYLVQLRNGDKLQTVRFLKQWQ
ncbi:MAG: T9SS type A sorting domain-containing protein [Saprospiraceae bacterium]|nr:T9SS type A sorting domain-containing protein [Saprospiraceae bacterium]